MEKFFNDHSSTPDVTADVALHRLLGDTLIVIDERLRAASGEEIEMYDEFYEGDDPYPVVDLEEDFELAVRSKRPAEEIEITKQALDSAKAKWAQRAAISKAFYHDIALARLGGGGATLLVITQDNPADLIQNVRLSKISVAQWAKTLVGVEIPEWDSSIRRRPTRLYTTPLLEVIEATILEHWETHNPERPPKKEMLKVWMREQYPNLVARGVLSEKLLDIIPTIIGQDKAK